MSDPKQTPTTPPAVRDKQFTSALLTLTQAALADIAANDLAHQALVAEAAVLRRRQAETVEVVAMLQHGLQEAIAALRDSAACRTPAKARDREIASTALACAQRRLEWIDELAGDAGAPLFLRRHSGYADAAAEVAVGATDADGFPMAWEPEPRFGASLDQAEAAIADALDRRAEEAAARDAAAAAAAESPAGCTAAEIVATIDQAEAEFHTRVVPAPDDGRVPCGDCDLAPGATCATCGVTAPADTRPAPATLPSARPANMDRADHRERAARMRLGPLVQPCPGCRIPPGHVCEACGSVTPDIGVDTGLTQDVPSAGGSI